MFARPEHVYKLIIAASVANLIPSWFHAVLIALLNGHPSERLPVIDDSLTLQMVDHIFKIGTGGDIKYLLLPIE